jgi:hypothetical protein
MGEGPRSAANCRVPVGKHPEQCEQFVGLSFVCEVQKEVMGAPTQNRTKRAEGRDPRSSHVRIKSASAADALGALPSPANDTLREVSLSLADALADILRDEASSPVDRTSFGGSGH